MATEKTKSPEVVDPVIAAYLSVLSKVTEEVTAGNFEGISSIHRDLAKASREVKRSAIK